MGAVFAAGKMPGMLWLAVTLKLLAEVALMALLGRWLLGWLVGGARERNAAWQVLAVVTRPPLRLAQALLRQAAPARGTHALAFAGLLTAWLGATAWKVQLVRACIAAGVGACQ